jgi:phenylalanyl-tRNA synthetase beta chain
MKLSKLWLKEWVNFSLTEQQLADQLTMAGLEVEAVSPVAGDFTHVIVAEVVSTKPHPDASKLTLCAVVTGEDTAPLNIVCGAANVRPGLKVALAQVGAHLPNGIHIKESRLRGELSQGMLCSVTELGLAEHSDGIMELDEHAPVGMDLRTYLVLDDHIFDIDLTPNRADCFSILGIAREAAVLNKAPLLVPECPVVPPTIDARVSVHVRAPKACPHYCGRVIRGINPHAVTPVWMAERLRRSGVRTVHPVVDIMNYVMLELGQPMHAFDLAQLNGAIEVRFASPEEQLELLDGQRVSLHDKVLIIADENKPLAIAGVMGGALSGVDAPTQDVFLESAFFNPVTIAGVARHYGLSSDSSQRYERGVDPQLQIKALERATALVLSSVGGQAGPVIEVTHEAYLPEKIHFDFDTTKIFKLTGISLPTAEIKALLEGLGLVIAEAGTVFSVQVPSHRFDIQHEVDLVEEVVRLHGYDKLKAQPMTGLFQAGTMSMREQSTAQLSHWFCTKGYHETINYSFVDPELQEALYPNNEFIRLLNPISSELSQMRVGMWPGLLASMIYNLHRQQNAIKFFEVGVVFDVVNQHVFERPCVAALVTGECGSLNWNQVTRRYDFYDLKGDIQSLLAQFKLEDVRFVRGSHEALHPGQTAQIVIAGQPAGWIGALHPRFADALEIEQEVLLCELSVDALSQRTPPRFQSISKYPQIRRDLSFLVDQQVSALAIEMTVRATVQDDWLKSFNVFDVYNGKEIPEGKKSIAITLTLQDANRTLMDIEINLLISAIIKALESNFSIILRE